MAVGAGVGVCTGVAVGVGVGMGVGVGVCTGVAVGVGVGMGVGVGVWTGVAVEVGVGVDTGVGVGVAPDGAGDGVPTGEPARVWGSGTGPEEPDPPHPATTSALTAHRKKSQRLGKTTAHFPALLPL